MPLTDRRTEFHRRDAASGQWLSVVADVDVIGSGRVRIEAGSTGNRLDPQRRVRRRGHDVVRADGRLELRSWWPVREVRTNSVGRFVADLRGELAAAGSPDVAGDVDRVTAMVGEVLDRDADRPDDDLVRRVLASAYPLLRHPLTAGARPDEIPVPLEPLLHHAEPRTAAQRSLGPRVTRPLVRALAATLLPGADGEIAWEPLLLALMAADRCGPEQLVSILTTRPHRPGAVSFSLTDIDRARTMFELARPRRIAEELVEALGSDGGTIALARRLIRHDARPPAAPAATPRPQRRAAPPTPPDHGDRPIVYPDAWTDADGREVDGSDGCVVVLPKTGNELLEWGAHMSNCLGAYRTTAAVGRTRIMGFAANGRLRYVAEISPSRILRQLEAPDNTLPLPSRERAIVTWLRQLRLIEADARRVT